MTSQELYGQLETILVDAMGVVATIVVPEASYAALGLSSLDVVELILIVEEELGLRIDDEELETIITLQQLADVLARSSQVTV